MNIYSTLLITSLFIQQILLAQAPDTVWTKTFGGSNSDQGYSVQQTFDGGYIITGRTKSFGSGQYDVWLIKTDSFGDTMWTRTFGGSNSDIGNSVLQTADSGYIITGGTISFGSGGDDLWLIKTDIEGDTLWTKTYGGSGTDVGNSVKQTNDSGYIVTGTTSFNVWLLKTDSSGDTLWTKTYTNGSGNSVQQTKDGGYIVTGYSDTAGFYNQEIWLAKTDAYGDTLWTKTFGGSISDIGNSVQQTSDGGYIITGHTTSFGTGNFWLAKTDSSGNTLWTKTYGGSDDEWGNSVKQTIDGGYIIAGSISSFGFADIWLVKVNSSGDTLWTKTFGGNENDFGFSVQQTTDSGYTIIGHTNSFGAGYWDIWLLKVAARISDIGHKDDIIPSFFTLTQNYPNPFNPLTKIKYQIPELSFVTLKVYDVLGNEITTLVNEEKLSGNFEVVWNANAFPSGVYFYQLQAGDFVDTKKMILMK